MKSNPKRVLMVGFQFPPFAGSSAIQRMLRFVQQLPEFGWEPVVLSAHPMAYETVSDDLLTQVPPEVPVHRALALDVARHLSVLGRYPAFMARPDRWSTWRFDAARLGSSLIRRYRPAAIWSTFPIPTAHVIGRKLRASSGLPWIADFRDPMAQDGYPADPKTWASFKAIEARTVRDARFSVFTTPSAARMYRARYVDVSPARITVIENGYDEESFVTAERAITQPEPLVPGVLTLLHSGVVYPSERDPTQFLDALAVLKSEAALPAFRIRFRASGCDAMIQAMVAQRGLESLVELPPALPYAQALDEMLRADALLVLQAANCNQQIPAKLYECLRSRRPVLGLTDPAGDTAGALRAAGLPWIAPLDDAQQIAQLLRTALTEISAGQAPVATDAAIQAASRQSRAKQLAGLLDAVCGIKKR